MDHIQYQIVHTAKRVDQVKNTILQQDNVKNVRSDITNRFSTLHAKNVEIKTQQNILVPLIFLTVLYNVNKINFQIQMEIVLMNVAQDKKFKTKSVKIVMPMNL